MDRAAQSRAGAIALVASVTAYSFTSLAFVPTHRPLFADLVFSVLSVRIAYDVLWMRRWLLLSCWILLPAAAVGLMWFEMWRLGQSIHDLLWWRMLAYIVLAGSVLVATMWVPWFREALWRVSSRRVSWLVAAASATVVGLLQLASQRGESIATLTVCGFGISVAALVSSFLVLVSAPCLSSPAILVCALLATAWLGAAAWAPAASPWIAGGMAGILVRYLCDEDAHRIAIGYSLFLTWGIASAANSVFAVAIQFG